MFTLAGIVVHGQARGSKVGMPTANIALPDTLKDIEYGVYACVVYLDEKKYLGVVNIGKRPTVDDKESIEVHILDFDEDIYGKDIRLDVYEYLRPIRKFDSLEEVKNQVDKDIIKTEEILKDFI
ncbi:MAG: riboflavin kinase [Erysipelotrichaceae bacterium]|nr:riboflavin kinase [Erysipelotrichaceae bacterium]